MNYLTYDEYQEIGGVLDLTAFSRNIHRAYAMIDVRTQSRLEQFEEIIVAYDNDESGDKYVKAVVPRLGSWRCKIVNLPSVVEINGKKIQCK